MWHGPLVKNGQMPENGAVAVQKRHAEITLDPHFDQGTVAGKPRLDAEGMMAKISTHHILARRSSKVELDVFTEQTFAPIGQRTNACRHPGELGNKGIADSDGSGQVPDQRLEENIARASGRPLDDRSQGVNLLVIGCRK